MTNEELIKQLEQAHSQIESLQKRVSQLEIAVRNISLPNTALLNESFLTRAFAVYGHVFVAGFIIAIPFYCIAILLGR